MPPEFQDVGGDVLLRAHAGGPAYARQDGLGYDAIKSKGRRKNPGARTLSEDMELRQWERVHLSTTVRDLNRNFAIAAWMIRCHLDYVSTFHFRMKTPDVGFNRDVENLMDWYSRAENCDPAGRFSFQRLRRMWEMRRVIDGDVLINRLKNGTVQTIEGDRIQSIMGVPYADLGITDPLSVINGVQVNAAGRAQQFMVFKRLPNWGGLIWDKAVSSRYADLFGYFDRYDQVRGISPLAAASNSLRDVYENFDYALLKSKVTQLIGLSIFRSNSDSFGGEGIPGDGSEGGREPRDYGSELDLGSGAPFLLDMDAGDKAEFLESKTPSTEFQAFTSSMIMVALRALDIPLSFYDESHTNFSGSRLAAIQYEKSTLLKRHDLRMVLNKITAWRMGLWIADDVLTLPAGMTTRDLTWEWAHTGTPWYDPMKEVSAAIAAINAGLSSPIREAKKLGLDVFELLDETAQVQARAKKLGIVLSTALATTAADDPNKGSTQKEDESEDEEAEKHPGKKATQMRRPIPPYVAEDAGHIAHIESLSFAADDDRDHRGRSVARTGDNT
jgi:capsid protein